MPQPVGLSAPWSVDPAQGAPPGLASLLSGWLLLPLPSVPWAREDVPYISDPAPVGPLPSSLYLDSPLAKVPEVLAHRMLAQPSPMNTG